MFKGFYNLTSGMLTQQRNLNVVANNMVNISTSGYKSDRYTSSTFRDVMMSRVGNKDWKVPQDIGNTSYIRASSMIYTNFEQGMPEPTEIPLDWAIEGDGFFAVQGMDGAVSYTRAGNFSLDEEGYLCLPEAGRVLDNTMQPIQLGTDKIEGAPNGLIYSKEGQYLGRIGVFVFADNGQLTRNQQGLFVGAQGTAVGEPRLYWKHLERSNVDMIQQMTEMITSQRTLQSAAQISKMYDQVMTKATTELGRL